MADWQTLIDSPDLRRADRSVSRRGFLCALAATVGASGCRTAERDRGLLPARHSVQADQLVVLSDFRLNYDHPLISNLIELRKEVADSLSLELNGPPVIVYLFPDEREYYSYLKTTYPSLPARRAYFIGTSFELAVYTYWASGFRKICGTSSHTGFCIRRCRTFRCGWTRGSPSTSRWPDRHPEL